MFRDKFLALLVGPMTKALYGEEPYDGLNYIYQGAELNQSSFRIARLENNIEELTTLIENLELGVITQDTLTEEQRTLITTCLGIAEILQATEEEFGDEKETPSESVEGKHQARQAKVNHSLGLYKKRGTIVRQAAPQRQTEALKKEQR